MFIYSRSIQKMERLNNIHFHVTKIKINKIRIEYQINQI